MSDIGAEDNQVPAVVVVQKQRFSGQVVAAIKIQTNYRGYLARQLARHLRIFKKGDTPQWKDAVRKIDSKNRLISGQIQITDNHIVGFKIQTNQKSDDWAKQAVKVNFSEKIALTASHEVVKSFEKVLQNLEKQDTWDLEQLKASFSKQKFNLNGLVDPIHFKVNQFPEE